MTRKTFILIVSIYGFLLAASMLFMPANAVNYFGGNGDNTLEVQLGQYLGMSYLAFNFTGFQIRKSNDSQVVKAYLIGLMIAFFGGIALALYNIFGRGMAMQSTTFIDWSIWAVLGFGALYFWNKEK